MRRVGGLIVILLLAGCGGPAPAPGPWVDADGYRYRDLFVEGGNRGLVAIHDTGVDFENRLSDAAIVQNRHRMNGSGVAVGDVDGDGLPDIFFAAMESSPVLYRNLGDWQFEDATARAGLDAAPHWSTGAVLADVDGDGDLDLLVTVLSAPNVLYLNDGTGRFKATTLGVESPRGSMSAAFADTDADGDLDLYVANYKRIALRDSLSPERLLFSQILGPDGRVLPELSAHYRVEEIGGRPIRLELGEEDQYYHNDGHGRFAPVNLESAGPDWGLGVRLEDLNGDGVPDLYVANDFESPDYFLMGDGVGGFTAGSAIVGHTSNSSMSIGVADVNRDGRKDLFVPDMLSPDPRASRYQAGTAAPWVGAPGQLDFVPQYMQNTLHLGSNGAWVGGSRRPAWQEVARAYGVAATEWSWSAVFTDVDLDGWDDLLITTGHSFDVQDVDAQAREREAIRGVRSVDAFRALILEYPRLELPNMAFRNLGGERFEPVGEGWGIGTEPDISHGMALGDFDLDGDLDVVINRLNRPAGLFRNDSAAPRVAVSFHLGSPNPDGVGLVAQVGGVTQEVVSGGTYLSGSQMLLSFAAVEDSPRLSVGRGGRRLALFDVRPNRQYQILALPSALPTSSSGTPQAAPEPAGPDASRAVAHGLRKDATRLTDGRWVGTWSDGTEGFLEITDAGGMSTRTVLPFQHPASVAAGDLDGDGFDEVFVAARVPEEPRGPSPESVLLRAGPAGFAVAERLDTGPVEGAVMADFNGDGAVDLVVAASWGGLRLFLNDGLGGLSESSDAWGLTTQTGLWQGLAAGDLDGDGKPDLVATNWGWNSAYGRVGAPDHHGRPLRRYQGDFDGDGQHEFVEAAWRADLEGWSPLEDFPTLRSRLPVLARRVTSHHAFAGMLVEDLLGGEPGFVEVTSLASTAFMNRGDRFDAVVLPLAVQLAAGQGVHIEDISGDGLGEVLIAQNVFDVPAGIMRQDAGRGVHLSLRDGTWNVRSLGVFGPQQDIGYLEGHIILSMKEGPVYRLEVP